MPFFDPALPLLRQLAEHFAQVQSQFRVPSLSAPLGDEHRLIFALPLSMTSLSISSIANSLSLLWRLPSASLRHGL